MAKGKSGKQQAEMTEEQMEAIYLKVLEKKKAEKEAEAEKLKLEKIQKQKEAEAKLKKEQEEHMEKIMEAISPYEEDGEINISKEDLVQLILNYDPLPTGKKVSKKSGGTSKKPEKVSNPDEIYTGEPCCLARLRNSYCGRKDGKGNWLCDKHEEVYEKSKVLKNGWWGCFGPDLCGGVETYDKKHEERMKCLPCYNRENEDLRPEECRAEYPLE